MKQITVTEPFEDGGCKFTFDHAGVYITWMEHAVFIKWGFINDVDHLSDAFADLKVKHFKQVVTALGNYSRIFNRAQFA